MVSEPKLEDKGCLPRQSVRAPKLTYQGAVSLAAHGGASAHLTNLANELAAIDRIQLKVIVPHFAKEKPVSCLLDSVVNVADLRVPKRGLAGHTLYELRVCLSYGVEFLKRYRGDEHRMIVLARISPFGISSWFGAVLGYRVVLEVNGLPDDETVARGYGRLANFCVRTVVRAQLRRARGAICVTMGLENAVRNRVPTLSTVVIENAAGRDLPIARRDEPGDPTLIVYSGAFAPWQEIDTLLHAVALLRDSDPAANWRLRLIGDGEQREHLEHLAGELSLSSCVEITGWLPPSEAAVSTLAGAVAVVPLRPKSPDGVCGSPLKAFEYLALGRAVVGSDVDGNLELAHLGLYFYRCGDAGDLARAISIAGHEYQMGQTARVDPDAVSWKNRAERVVAFITTNSTERTDDVPCGPRE